MGEILASLLGLVLKEPTLVTIDPALYSLNVFAWALLECQQSSGFGQFHRETSENFMLPHL